MPLRLFCLLSLFLCCAFARAADAPVVVVLANSDDPDSLAVARHYVKARALPEENIIALPLPLTEQITWREFVVTLHRPLQAELVKRGWIDAIAMDLEDDVGRRKLAVSNLHVAALVICRGVPLRIAHDAELAEKTAKSPVVPSAMQTNAASVDSELALLAAVDVPINGFVPNPLFANTDPDGPAKARIIPVGRLDGPTAADARALVDRAIRAEREGLVGRAYVDIGGPHAQGDNWLRETADELTKLGFAPDVDTAKTTFAASARFDAPVFYFGWYDRSISGPLKDPAFRFPVGAVAMHIHSFSATTLRNGNGPWVPSLVARGVTLTVGNVNEPFLQFTHQPQRLLRALAAGRPAGEAALESLNALSWQAILIGDPLYRPFTVSFDDQWRRLDETEAAQASYLYLRKINLLDAEGFALKAKSQAWAALRKSPSLPVVLDLARRQLETRDRRGTRQTLAIISGLPNWRTQDVGLIASGARLLVEAEEAAEAVAWYKRLLDDKKLGQPVRVALLAEAQAAARAALDFTQAGRWEAELKGPPAP